MRFISNLIRFDVNENDDNDDDGEKKIRMKTYT